MTNLDILYRDFGQSPWLDNIRRDWLKDGTLKKLVREGVRGVTSNPSIFAKSLATTSAYEQRSLSNRASPLGWLTFPCLGRGILPCDSEIQKQDRKYMCME